MKQCLLLLLLLFTCCLACKKDRTRIGNIDSNLTGTWTKPAPNTSVATGRESIEFFPDGYISISRYYINPSSQQIMGYNYKYAGKYRVTGNGLIQLYNMNVLSNTSTDPFVAIDKLTAKGNSADQQYTYQLTSLNTKLSWTIVCPPNADCIGTQQYTKQ
jgi:hypothetical protein